jgi:CHAT domain-containing protein
MRPIRKRLGEAQMVLLSPDGPLHLLPFEALVDENGRYLLETFTFVYLTTGRDLVRLRDQPSSREESVIMANPAFDDIGATQVAQGSWTNQEAPLRSSKDASDFFYAPLPGSIAEAEAVKQMLPKATLLLGTQATKAALQELHGPHILHLATHGFFLKDQDEEAWEPDDNLELRPVGDGQHHIVGTASSLLYSGLALAGANRPEGGIEYGLLTALEAAALDLWGTKLVVLSACETGVGGIGLREGVYGLRRAMVIAGAESQVMSLWKVDDSATQGLIVDYYRRLLTDGIGRAEGLRQAQLAMLQGAESWRSTVYWVNILKRLLFGEERTQALQQAQLTLKRGTGWWRHPYYWAGFIAAGNWRPLSREETGERKESKIRR